MEDKQQPSLLVRFQRVGTDRVFETLVPATMNVGDIKRMLAQSTLFQGEGFRQQEIRIRFSGTMLEDKHSLRDYHVRRCT
jgi:hypothetical protein